MVDQSTLVTMTEAYIHTSDTFHSRLSLLSQTIIIFLTSSFIILKSSLNMRKPFSTYLQLCISIVQIISLYLKNILIYIH